MVAGPPLRAPCPGNNQSGEQGTTHALRLPAQAGVAVTALHSIFRATPEHSQNHLRRLHYRRDPAPEVGYAPGLPHDRLILQPPLRVQ